MSEKKIPNIAYGRLQEAVNISEYSLERALDGFEWLLEEERWKQVGDGFEDINEFVKTISLSDFKMIPEQRKEIVKKLAELNVSQRATAEIIGTSHSTINRDLNDSVTNVTDEEETTTDNEVVTNDSVTNVTEEEEKALEKEAEEEENHRFFADTARDLNKILNHVEHIIQGDVIPETLSDFDLLDSIKHSMYRAICLAGEAGIDVPKYWEKMNCEVNI